MNKRQRPPFIATEAIPDTLCVRRGPSSGTEKRHLLKLPRLLVEVYRELLDDLGLRQEAERQTPNDEGPQGGLTEEATREHFSRNFSGSCARVQFVTLDPMEEFKTTRDMFVRLFAGGKVHLLDVPCGTGAAGATLLCLAAELRQQKILPRHPLHVSVLGGDISEPARQLKRRVFRKLAPRLAEFGIRARADVRHWDVQDEDQTSELISEWVRQRPPRSAAVTLAANFSGFLSTKVKDCKEQLKEIIRYARVQEASVLWVEPRTNLALDHLFPALQSHVFGRIQRMRAVWPNGPRQAECDVSHPVQRKGQFKVRCAAMHLEPDRKSK